MKFYWKVISFLTLIVLTISLSTIANQSAAAIKSVKVLSIKPIIISKLTGHPGDQISDALISNGAIIITGTVEGATGDWVSSPALGGSDGYISALDFTGKLLWNLRLGTSLDEDAVSIAKDGAGNFWLLGASNATGSLTQTLPSPTPSSTTTGSVTISTASVAILNPDNVKVDLPTAGLIGSGEFQKIVIWKIDRTGHLLDTYIFSARALVNPLTLSFVGGQFTIGGQIIEIVPGSKISLLKNFALSLNLYGSFGQLVLSKFIAPSIPSSLAAPHGTTIWKTFPSNVPIFGLPSWNPKKAIPLLIQYNKSGKILDARYFSGKALFLRWQSKPGLVLLTEQSGGFGLTIVNPVLD